VNGRPHVGHALELVQADVLARYYRLIGNKVRFQTGVDENAFKNVLSARAEGITAQELVDRNTKVFKELCKALDISHNHFIRTTSAEHRQTVHWFWNRLNPKDIYRKYYTGLYCTGCEDFYIERDLIDGLCPDHGTRPVEVEEENYFFRLSGYQEQIEELIHREIVRIIPSERRNEVLAFILRGIQDISISRSAERSEGWGISVPGNLSQVIYVWIDALINYISGLGYGGDEANIKFWEDNVLKIHVIGKNVWKFHAIHWLALLISAGFPLPSEIFVHGFLTEDGQKISKSRGFTIDPIQCISEIGVEAVRYYLLRSIPATGDGDFSLSRVAQLYNTDLANSLGNLVSRLTTLCEKAEYENIGEIFEPEAPEGFHEALARYRFDDSLRYIWSKIGALNQAIDHNEPWKFIKDGRTSDLYNLLSKWVKDLHQIGYWLQPFLPEIGARIIKILTEKRITKCAPILPRLKS